MALSGLGYTQCNYSVSCHFEAVGREIPAARQLAERLLGKFMSRLWFTNLPYG